MKLKTHTRRSPEVKEALLKEFRETEITARDFCRKHELSGSTFKWWCQEDPEMLELYNLRNRAVAKKIAYTFDERKAAVEAYLKSEMSFLDFAKVYGVSSSSVTLWTKIYREVGPEGLHNININRNKGRKPIPDSLKKEITQVKLENPNFGMRKVRDFLRRFKGVKVSHKTVGKTLKEENIPVLEITRNSKRAKDMLERKVIMEKLVQFDLVKINRGRLD
ncbi:MAG: helix-turn-helix domain-containing protein [Pseudobdellovibrio sp.]